MRRWLIVLAVICLAVGLCACESGTPLGKTAKTLQKDKEKEKGAYSYDVGYNEATETLYLSVGKKEDVDHAFEVMNENVKEQEIGNLVFLAQEGTDEAAMSAYDAGIAALPCKSLKTLSLSSPLLMRSGQKWPVTAAKAQLTMLDVLPAGSQYQNEGAEALKNVKRIWVANSSLGTIDSYTDLEELGICGPLLNGKTIAQIDPATVEEKEGDDSSSEDKEKKEVPEQVEGVFSFNASYEPRMYFEKVKKAKNLKKLLIAPGYKTYEADSNGSGYLYLLQNHVPDLLVNVPGQETVITREAGAEDSSLKRVRDVELKNLNTMIKKNILTDFLRPQTKPCFKKGKKLKVKKRKPVVYGKALIYKATPDMNKWKDKRKYYSNGSLIWSDQLSGKIPTPDFKDDYDTFIYVYPTYVHVGNYDKGTKGYKKTVYAQVFDLKRGIAYKAHEIDSAMPPERFTYYGLPPDKKSGDVSDEKIYKYLKKLKTKAAPEEKKDEGTADTGGQSDAAAGGEGSGDTGSSPATSAA